MTIRDDEALVRMHDGRAESRPVDHTKVIDQVQSHRGSCAARTPTEMSGTMGDQSQPRFDAYVQAVLANAGWYPGRDASDSVEAWLGQQAPMRGDLTPSPAALAFLKEFGGLTLVPFGPGRDSPMGFSFSFYPFPDRIVWDVCQDFHNAYGYSVFPVGFHHDAGRDLLMDKTGRIFWTHWAYDFDLGPGDQAISLLAYCETGPVVVPAPAEDTPNSEAV